MKVHSTNYFDTFIEVAEDTKALAGTAPPAKEKKTIAEYQYELLIQHPYKYTSDDILFRVYADRNDLHTNELEDAKVQFFAKGQPCFRTSPLTKTYGFGVHSDKDGKIALYPMDSPEYQKFVDDDSIKKVKAMKATK